MADTADDLVEMEFAAEMDGMNMNAKKVHEEKDKKMARMQQLCFLNSAQANAHSDIAEANKRKAAAARKVQNQHNMIEDLQNTVKELSSKVESCESRNRESEHRQRELDSLIEQNRKAIDGTIMDKFEALSAGIKREEENRGRMGQELQQMIRLREQKFKQSLLNELNEESNARIAVSSDVSKLAEDIKDVKASLDDECAKMNAKMASMHAKLKGEITDVISQLNTERIMRERADIATKSDVDMQIRELKNNFETKNVETDQEQALQLSTLNHQMQMVEQHFDLTKNMMKDMVDELDRKRSKKLSDMNDELSAKIDGLGQQLEEKNQTWNSRSVELKGDIKACGDEAKRSLRSVASELAAEHLRREQDESAIINMLDTFMRQVKEMNTPH